MDETPTAFFAGLDVAFAPRELVALGGRLDVETLLAAYRSGCFPWPATGPYLASLDRDARRLARHGDVPLVPGTDHRAPLMPWISPHPRPVLLPDRVNIPRTVRRSIRRSRWETTMDHAFDDVIAGCADRNETWLTSQMRQGYQALHHAGIAHSLEVWSGDDLVGGLYGVLTGRVFNGESMFHHVPDASKAAVVDLCQRFCEAGVVLIDTQDESEHMANLGQVLVNRADYIDVLRSFRDEPVELPGDRRPVSRLLG
ncbi:MAG TPA: leucyl/phenylalanyl-tRNA--protein transferase [Acidimicrobiia bacterium]|nr:leucyl/phenylalanyl-tRNA--protein transferase [Acidimicrobiia bacterium]